MTVDFCDNFYAECAVQLSLPEDYCVTHTGVTLTGAGQQPTSQYWSYPLVIDGEFLSTRLKYLYHDRAHDTCYE